MICEHLVIDYSIAHFLVDSDYIGCFKKTGGLVSSGKPVYSDITPCYCIGYCKSLNYSLAGAYKK